MDMCSWIERLRFWLATAETWWGVDKPRGRKGLAVPGECQCCPVAYLGKAGSAGGADSRQHVEWRGVV